MARAVANDIKSKTKTTPLVMYIVTKLGTAQAMPGRLCAAPRRREFRRTCKPKSTPTGAFGYFLGQEEMRFPTAESKAVQARLCAHRHFPALDYSTRPVPLAKVGDGTVDEEETKARPAASGQGCGTREMHSGDPQKDKHTLS